MNIELQIASNIKESSWLNEKRFEWFVKGYEFASTQMRSIPALSQTRPEDMYFAVSSVVRGAARDKFEHMPEKLKRIAEQLNDEELKEFAKFYESIAK
jgi:cytochrome c553